MNNFWSKLEKPILALAPMADVTDSAFRHIISKYSKGNDGFAFVTWTEFVSADGLVLAPEEGRKKLLKDLEYSEIERPIVAQFFTSKPENMRKAAKIALDLGFDGVDINMGCPDKSIEKQGAGAALIKTPEIAKELIRAAKEGVQNKIPISVKTRLGYNTDILEEWLPQLLSENLAVITIHARTRKEMSLVPARWERIKRAIEIRNNFSLEEGKNNIHTPIFGNGDVRDVPHAYELAKESGADGVMLGRAIFGNPFLFAKNKEVSLEEKLRVMVEHTKLFEEKLGNIKSFAVMKKHYKAYVKEFPEAAELRHKLMEANNASEVENIVNNFFNK